MRKKLLNRNSIPFFILAIIHFYLLIQIFKKCKQRSTWILLFTNIGFAYLFEYVVLNIFNSYRYKPKIMRKRYFDNIFGAILSQALFVPISATFLTAYKKGWSWKLSFTIFYFLIENLFLRLKVYKVNWWNPLYTLVLINFYFVISDAYHSFLITKKKWALHLSQYLMVVVIDVNLMYINAVLGNFRFGKGLIRPWEKHFIVAPLYSLFISLLTVFFSAKHGLTFYIGNLLSNLLLDWVLIKNKVLKLKQSFILKNILFELVMIGLSRILYQQIIKQK